MSRGTKLQEMEQSKTAVNANATPGDAAMPKAGKCIWCNCCTR